jgi:hypothetical protein
VEKQRGQTDREVDKQRRREIDGQSEKEADRAKKDSEAVYSMPPFLAFSSPFTAFNNI